MSFPTSPTNGQIAVVNNVAYEYATANSSWTRVLSIANVIQANVISANVLNVVQAFSITGNIATGNYFIGNGAFLTGIAAGSSYSNANVAAYLPTYTGNLVSLTGPITTTGNITANNVLFGTGVVSGTGTVYAATVSTTGNVNSGYLSTGPASVGNLISGGYITATGNVTGGNLSGTNIVGTLTTASQTNITSVGTLTALTVTGNIQTGNLRTAGLISATGDITTAGNVAALNFNSTFADLAEIYSADAAYLPGTVLDFGGEFEVTVAQPNSPKIAGVVSTNPSYLMNSTLESTHTIAVALTGRVPTFVIGPVYKGAMMVSAGNGHAQACATPAMGTVIGKAVEDFAGESGTIEIAVGRL
jgi:hypothetical protein